MRVDQIEIHSGAPEFEFESIRQLEAKCEAMTNFSKAPTMQDVNLKLQQMAAGIGADAVIHVKYDSGISLTSWRSMKATGLAVRRVSDERACPVCAETIKRAAIKCRFCGADLSSAAAPVSSVPAETAPPPALPATPSSETPTQRWAATNTQSRIARPRMPAPSGDPLKSNDNPATIFVMVGIGLIVIIFLISIAGG